MKPCCFPKRWRNIATCLEPGKSLVITVAAEDRPEGINLRIQTVKSLEDEASLVQKALRIFVRDAGPLGTLVGSAFNARARDR